MATIDFNTVSPSAVQSFEAQQLSYFNALYPEMNTAKGSPTYELTVRPVSVMFATEESRMLDFVNNFSLVQLQTVTNPTTVQDTYADQVASNFNITRKAGTVAAGTLVIYTSQTSDIYINQNMTFSSKSQTLVLAKTYVGTTDLTGKVDTDAVAYKLYAQILPGVYAFTVPVTTKSPYSGSIEVGQAVTPATNLSQVTSVQVASPITGGSTTETTAELATRVAQGITCKVPSGSAQLTALFKNIDIPVYSIASFGMGDPEMLRDRNNIAVVSGGGCCDTYVKTAQLPAVTAVAISANRLEGDIWRLNITRELVPGFYNIASLAYANSNYVITDQNDMGVEFRAETQTGEPAFMNGIEARYSMYQAATVEFIFPGITGTTADFNLTMSYMPSLVDLQSYINQSDVRNPAQSVVIKGAVPVFVGINMKIKVNSTTTTATATDLQNLVAAYINNLPISASTVSAGNIAALITATYPELTLNLPIKFQCSMPLPDGSNYVWEDNDGEIAVTTFPAQGVTERNTAFFCQAADITVNLVTL